MIRSAGSKRALSHEELKARGGGAAQNQIIYPIGTSRCFQRNGQVSPSALKQVDIMACETIDSSRLLHSEPRITGTFVVARHSLSMIPDLVASHSYVTYHFIARSRHFSKLKV